MRGQEASALKGAVNRTDEHTFDRALAPLIDPAHRLASALLRDPVTAEDMVQEAAVKAWCKLGHLREDTALGPWFLGIVAHECRSYLRKQRRRTTILSRFFETSGDIQDPSAREDVLTALRMLRPEDQALLILYFYMDLPIPDLARAVHASTAATKSRLYRAIEKLRLRLGD
jgi:RNA polymerase sigma-70 factor (ECF subfamily)